MKGVVYFIQSKAQGAVKIGYTNNIENRRAELQCGNPEPLHVMHVLGAPASAERALHRIFRSYRMSGEWFRWLHPVSSVVEGIIEQALDHEMAVAFARAKVARWEDYLAARGYYERLAGWRHVANDPQQPPHLIACCRESLKEHGEPLEVDPRSPHEAALELIGAVA